jgi:hypothetical protein
MLAIGITISVYFSPQSEYDDAGGQQTAIHLSSEC